MEGGIKWNLFEVPLGAAVWDVNTHLGYYFNHVNEGIRWLPNGQGHSSPVNIESLQSEGLEWNLDLAVGAELFQHSHGPQRPSGVGEFVIDRDTGRVGTGAVFALDVVQGRLAVGP